MIHLVGWPIFRVNLCVDSTCRPRSVEDGHLRTLLERRAHMCPRVPAGGTRWVYTQRALWQEPEEREKELALDAPVEREDRERTLARMASVLEPEPVPEPARP